MRSLIEWLRAPETQDTQPEQGHLPPERDEPSLFECPECDTVYVGTTIAACLADLGYTVTNVDIDESVGPYNVSQGENGDVFAAGNVTMSAIRKYWATSTRERR